MNKDYSTKELNELISSVAKKNKNLYLHLSRYNKTKKDLENVHQPLVEEFNCGGRPNGLWYSHGNSWINLLVKNKNVHPIFKTCCYLYELKLNKENILDINNIEKLKLFDAKYPDYWLNNEEYYLCDFRGLNPTKFIDYSDFQTFNKNKRLFDYLESKNVVFSNETDFRYHIKKYKIDFNKDDIELRRCKRWDIVSEKYNGIEFSPFINHNNIKNINWYKSIAIDSGCIWDVSSINSMNLIAEVYSQKHDHIKNRWKLTDYGELLLN